MYAIALLFSDFGVEYNYLRLQESMKGAGV